MDWQKAFDVDTAAVLDLRFVSDSLGEKPNYRAVADFLGLSYSRANGLATRALDSLIEAYRYSLSGGPALSLEQSAAVEILDGPLFERALTGFTRGATSKRRRLCRTLRELLLYERGWEDGQDWLEKLGYRQPEEATNPTNPTNQ